MIGAMMAMHIFETQTLRTPPPPPFWGSPEMVAPPSKKTYPGIALYPEELREAIDKIHRCFPEVFRVLSAQFEKGISIEVQVDLPIVKKEFVKASDLKKRNIQVGDLVPDTKGLFSIDDLYVRGIKVGPSHEGFKAYWDFGKRTLTLGHAHYSQYKADAIYKQVFSLLFELQNAQYTSLFEALFQKGSQISKANFVRGFETIEFSTTRLTFHRLERMEEEGEFDEVYNQSRYMYPDLSLYYLHQQAVGHSGNYGRIHDTAFGTEKRTPYQGTWKVPFPSPDREGTLSQEQFLLARILSDHIEALYEPNQRVRTQKETELQASICAVREGASAGFALHKHLLANLEHFQGEYRKYVDREKPQRVINLI
jgi:hypothetical protein